MQIATPLACSLALAVGAAVLTACDPSVPAADPPLADPYDVGKMTLKSAPAGDGSPGGDEDRQPWAECNTGAPASPSIRSFLQLTTGQRCDV
jgi:hypothetical protein